MEIMIPARNIPVLTEADICVIGGGTTGVFAALRAARHGAKTVLIERGNRPGGTATLSLVCYWHTLFDLSGKRRIIAGLTQELIDRLARRDAVKIHEPDNPSYYVTLNTEELSIELEETLREAGVEIFYHTMFLAPLPELRGIRVGGKNGEYAILAKRFVDATGDGDLIHALGLPRWSNPEPQPPSCCAKLSNYPFCNDASIIGELIHRNAARYGLPEGHIWGCPLHKSPLYFLSGTKIANLNVAGIKELSQAEIEGRRQLRAILDIIAEAGYPRPTLEALPSLLGIRDSFHIHALYRVTDDDLLSGRAFPDLIRSWDVKEPTDTNVFTARRSRQEHLSKKEEDRAAGHLAFGGGLTSEKDAVFEEDATVKGRRRVFSFFRLRDVISLSPCPSPPSAACRRSARCASSPL